MSCSPALTRALIRFAEKSAENKTALEDALETAIAAVMNGEEKVISASADGSSFSRMTGGMTNEMLVGCLDNVLNIIDNHDGRMPNTTTYAHFH